MEVSSLELGTARGEASILQAQKNLLAMFNCPDKVDTTAQGQILIAKLLCKKRCALLVFQTPEFLSALRCLALSGSCVLPGDNGQHAIEDE